MDENQTPQTKKKGSSVRHTRAIQRDRSKRPLVSPPDDQVERHLYDIVHPATMRQVAHFHEQGLRERTLTLPVMVALLLSMVWRQIGGVSELARVVKTESMLWAASVTVS